MNKLAPYNKTIAALVIGVLGWASSVVTSNPAHVTAGEWVQLGTAIATAFGVYSVSNNKSAKE